MCGSMVDIQSATAEKEKKEEEKTTAAKQCPHLLRMAAIMSIFRRHLLLGWRITTLSNMSTYRQLADREELTSCD